MKLSTLDRTWQFFDILATTFFPLDIKIKLMKWILMKVYKKDLIDS